jgi:hypothetical protein
MDCSRQVSIPSPSTASTPADSMIASAERTAVSSVVPKVPTSSPVSLMP